MNGKKLLLFTLLSLLSFSISSHSPTNPPEFDFPTFEEMPKTHLPCHRMKRAIENHAKTLHIPKNILYGVAFYESRYQGEHHTSYNHAVVGGGAYGPMQILLSTARSINKDQVTVHKLTNDLEYNVATSAKLLHKLYKIYGDWKKVLGAYNTGRPIVNGYAIKVYNYKPSI
jgi:soluble lytic murein transglycosylase-like protein